MQLECTELKNGKLWNIKCNDMSFKLSHETGWWTLYVDDEDSILSYWFNRNSEPDLNKVKAGIKYHRYA